MGTDTLNTKEDKRSFCIIGTMWKLLCFLALAQLVWSQQLGHQKSEDTLDLKFEKCTLNGGCKKTKGGVTLDSNWRWTHKVNDYKNCYTGNTWDKTLCPDAKTCTKNCALDGVDYATWAGTYGVHIYDGDTVELKFVTQGPYSKNIGSRNYLLDASHERYEMFQLLNQEFTFDVDVSNLPCGLNGALYFVAMEPDGGKHYSTNQCGAKYGTGYCDAQCPHDMKFISGEANSKDWKPSNTDKNAGTGHYGSCCAEMDIWEANSITQAFTTHPCSIDGSYRCEGTECGDNESNERYAGVCDKDGCDFGSWRLGDQKFYGPGNNYKVNTQERFTVVTQFITDDGTANGKLAEVRRLYVQNGNVIQNSKVNFDGIDAYDSISNDFCENIKPFFGDNPYHNKLGGLTRMGEQMRDGMVLVMSMWDDHAVNMLWLDSDYPLDADPTKPGVNRGPCPRDSGKPDEVERDYPHSSVMYGKVRIGDIDSTY